ncbi:hypothetical protein QQB40_003345 [Salmonella enterica]|nr:hypothetical protein [Salmonella enterica]
MAINSGLFFFSEMIQNCVSVSPELFAALHITLVLAVLLGGMIGAGIVLGRNALRSYKPKAL